MSQILFYTGTKAQYDALATKNENALYFLTDVNRLYKGAVPFSQPVQLVTTFPASGDNGVIYVNSSTHSLLHSPTSTNNRRCNEQNHS